ncbi:hypothetical protein C7C56_009315 [Massilia glaciei]|uniref:DegT/DnrJ/EryC1/StrS aminotransferase family protein n=2 Tax=Massilia glaciei TaxID=1524097 RepID=A0A2U2HN30_9BURK|nr:hypothetical protein C7C56_009315 [Massilia glaciei]
MPRFLCDSMRAPLELAGIGVKHYSLNARFEIADEVALGPDDWLFYVDYFGVCSTNVDQILRTFNPDQVVLDHSQAFFSPPRDCLATIFSARKFFGVADGGLLVTKLPVSVPAEIDETTLERATHLLKRLIGPAELGYADYQRAEYALTDCKPRRMSALTERLLSSVAFEDVREARVRNFRLLHARLGCLNRLPLELDAVEGPLCYPFLAEGNAIREILIRNRVFVPTYWPDVLNTSAPSSCEYELVNNLIPLPCDQRYGVAEMEKIGDIVSGFFRK